MIMLAGAAPRRKLVSLIAAWPRLTFTAAGLPGVASRVARTSPPTVAELAALLGDVPEPTLRGIERAIAKRIPQNRLLEVIVNRRGVGTLASHVRAHGFEPLRALRAEGRSAVLVTWHTGPYLAVGAALLACGLDFLALRHRVRGPACAGVHILPTGGGPWEATVALKQAITRLAGGGLVVMAGDGLQGESGTDVELLGRQVAFQRGLAVLAHHAGVPVFPVTARWQGGRVEVRLHEPLPVATTDQDELLRQAARWLDGYLRATPEELRPDRVRLLLSAPLVDGRRASA